MTWAVVGADGHIRSIYGRQASAEANAGGGTVVEAPAEAASNPRGWRHDGVGWVKARREVAAPVLSHREARRQAYAQQIEADLQFEALVEAVQALATPAARAADPAAFAKLDALAGQIAAIKTAHPKR